jgi:hypothetical protein
MPSRRNAPPAKLFSQSTEAFRRVREAVIKEAEELPQGLYGSARASALAGIDRRYDSNAVIVADLSNDATYAEVLFETFGPRVIGLTISRNGDIVYSCPPGQHDDLGISCTPPNSVINSRRFN